MQRLAVLVALVSAAAWAAEKPCINYKPPASDDPEDRPVATGITVGPQGSDYALKVEFDKAPWGEACGSRCANTTIFLDTDNNKTTGLKLNDPKAAENGADLAITVQGNRDYKEQSAVATLKVKVKQFSEDATSIESGTQLVELDSRHDEDRISVQDKVVYLLIDANIGSLPSGPKIRVVYHPPDNKPLSGFAKGLSAPGANRVEIFKQGKLTNPTPKSKKKKNPEDEDM
jgi:hypothetical protein